MDVSLLLMLLFGIDDADRMKVMGVRTFLAGRDCFCETQRRDRSRGPWEGDD